MTISTSPIITTVSMPEDNDAALLTLSEATGPTFFKIGRNLVTTVGDLRRWIEEQKQGCHTADPGVS
jgi:hypothetical protein